MCVGGGSKKIDNHDGCLDIRLEICMYLYRHTAYMYMHICTCTYMYMYIHTKSDCYVPMAAS